MRTGNELAIEHMKLMGFSTIVYQSATPFQRRAEVDAVEAGGGDGEECIAVGVCAEAAEGGI